MCAYNDSTFDAYKLYVTNDRNKDLDANAVELMKNNTVLSDVPAIANNKMFKMEISLPKNYDKTKSYPLILLNDGEIFRLKALKDKAIIIGLKAENRLDAFTPKPAKNIRPGMPDFGGSADKYHHLIFETFLPEILSEYNIDYERIVYGGYSLGGLAAVYSLSTIDIPGMVFSLCGSFWYPDFIKYCEDTDFKNKKASVYLLNGKNEGDKHNNILENAPKIAKDLHSIIKEKIMDVTSVFDNYGHHENLESRYSNLCIWLSKKLKV
nr:alpha/beta hydrolase-fold protein [uncultured Lachnoanaerobaculum sp.]